MPPDIIDETVPHETIRRPLADEKGVTPLEINEPVVEQRRFSTGGLIAGAVIVVLIVLGVVWLIGG